IHRHRLGRRRRPPGRAAGGVHRHRHSRPVTGGGWRVEVREVSMQPGPPDPAPSSPVTRHPPPATRRWVLLFAALAALGLAAVSINWLYNRSRWLTPEQVEALLAEARQKWQRLGPADYDMELRLGRNNPQPGGAALVDSYKVKVRGGKVVGVTANGQPLPERQFDYYSLPAQFDAIEDYLVID